jgi:hypothetical protein
MGSFSFRQTLIRGITLALPLALVLYVLIRVAGMMEKMIGPIAKKAGIDKILGEVTLTVITILCLVILIFGFGLLMQFAFISSFRVYLQEWILKLVPSLNHLKLIAAEKLDIEDAPNTWKPVLIEKDDQFSPAFIIEETNEWITLIYVKPPSTETHNMVIAKKSSVHYKEITMKQMIQFNKQFGKGYIKLVEGNNADPL